MHFSANRMRGSLMTVPLLFVILLLYPCISSSAEFERLSPFATEKLLHTPAPDFRISKSGNNETMLSAFRGSVLLISFWSDRCPTCLPDRESLKQLRSITDPSMLKIISVHAGKPGPHLCSASAPEGLIMIDDSSLEITIGRYSITALPAAILLDKNGIVVKIYRGQQNWTESKSVLEIQRLIQKTK